MPSRKPSAVGKLLRKWRTTRRMSQLELAGEAKISTRHISFVENGRAQPSREMVLVLASVLELPLRERNRLLTAAGFASIYRETGFDDPSMAQVKQTLELMLAQAEPFPAMVMNRQSDLLMHNRASERLTTLLTTAPERIAELGPANLLRQLLHPSGLRDAIVNWEEVARAVVGRAMREAEVENNAQLQAILTEVLRYPGVPSDVRCWDLREDPPLLIPIHCRKGPLDAHVFTTITTLGTAQDITLHELRVEVFYPADAPSERALRQLAQTCDKESCSA